MKFIHKILFLSLFLYSVNIVAQKNTVDSKAFNIWGSSDYLISAKTSGNAYLFTMYALEDGPSSPKNVSFAIRPLTKESFIQSFFSNYAKFQNNNSDKAQQILEVPQNISYDITKPDTSKSSAYKKLEAEATKLFYLFVAESIVYEDRGNEPIAGTICYVDSLLVLRRDVNGQTLQSRILRLWKVYKKDRKLVKILLKNGALDDYLDSGDTVSFESLKALVELNRETGSTDTISREFDFLKIMEQLNKRRFLKEKETEFLQMRARTRQAQYELKLIELNDNGQALKANKDSLNFLTNILPKLDTLKSFETQRKALTNSLKEAHKNYNQFGRIIGEMEPIYNKYKELNFETGAPKEKIDAIGTRLQYIDQMILSFNCNESTWHENVNKLIADEKKIFVEALNQENRALELADNQSDSMMIKKNITIYESIIQDFNRFPEVELPKLCEYVNALIALNEEQDRLVSRFMLNPEMGQVLPERTDTLKLEEPNISIPNYSAKTSDELISAVDNKVSFLKSDIKSLKEFHNRLEEKRKKTVQTIAQEEDQLIFKSFKVDSIVIEINEGFIENILMVGKVNEYADKYGHLKIGSDGKAVASLRTLKFENSSPIGFSRKLDFDAIKGKKLYTRGGGRTQYETELEDVLSIYIQEHEVGRRDYSPANQKVVLKNSLLGQADLCMGLKKEATYKLFEAKIFSDFVGLDETTPNGLIQTEISKRINLLTSRKPFQFIRFAGMRNEWNFGIVSFVEPSLTLSKIENNNKFLPLNSEDRFISNQYAPIKYTSTLQLKQFENFSAGANANLFLLDIPNIKSTFFLNYGFRYGRTGIQDSIRTATNNVVQVDENSVLEFGVNTFDVSQEIMWNIYADERYGFSMSWQHHWFYLRDNRFLQVANNTFFDNQVIEPDKKARQFNTFRFLMTLEQTSNNKGRLFFRYTYNWQQGFWRTGFHQAQVGYSFFLLGRPTENQ